MLIHSGPSVACFHVLTQKIERLSISQNVCISSDMMISPVISMYCVWMHRRQTGINLMYSIFAGINNWSLKRLLSLSND